MPTPLVRRGLRSGAPEPTRPVIPRRTALFAILVAGLLAQSVPGPAVADGLREKILEDRYGRGDYGGFLGWHDPADWQFDEQGSAGWPVGLKVRFSWRERFRIETDFGYYRTGSDPDPSVSTFSVPEFDGLMVAATFQTMLLNRGRVRPYVGGGPVFVSLANEYGVIRPDVREADPDNPDQRAFARWSRFDVGMQVVAGVDFPTSRRAFPFVEYRQLFGELTLDDSDVKIGSFSLPSLDLAVDDLEAVPDDPTPGAIGRKYSRTYDWSGPVIMVGLKVRF